MQGLQTQLQHPNIILFVLVKAPRSGRSYPDENSRLHGQPPDSPGLESQPQDHRPSHFPYHPPVEEVVVDGFESFEFSQYYPIHHHVAVEKETDFFLYFTDSELRRNGRMTGTQKKRRQVLEMKLGRPDPKAIEKDMREVLEVVLGPLKKSHHPQR